MVPLTIRQALESTHEGENAFKVDSKQIDLVSSIKYIKIDSFMWIYI